MIQEECLQALLECGALHAMVYIVRTCDNETAMYDALMQSVNRNFNSAKLWLTTSKFAGSMLSPAYQILL